MGPVGLGALPVGPVLQGWRLGSVALPLAVGSSVGALVATSLTGKGGCSPVIPLPPCPSDC